MRTKVPYLAVRLPAYQNQLALDYIYLYFYKYRMDCFDDGGLPIEVAIESHSSVYVQVSMERETYTCKLGQSRIPLYALPPLTGIHGSWCVIYLAQDHSSGSRCTQNPYTISGVLNAIPVSTR